MVLSNYLIIAASILFAEVLRRCYHVYVFAFTGPLAKIPGPILNKLTTLPHMVSMAKGTSFLYFQELHEKYGPIIRTGEEPNLIVVSDRDLVKKIVIEWDLPKAQIYKLINQIHQEGISIVTELNEEKHKKRRRLLSHGFSVSYLKGLEPLMLSCIDLMKQVMNEACDKANGSVRLDMLAMLTGVTFDIISETSFGGSFKEVKVLDSPPDSMKLLLTQSLYLNAFHTAVPFAKYLPFIFPARESSKLTSNLKYIVQRRREAIANKETIKEDLLQIFLNAHEEDPSLFTKKDIHSEMMFFAIAGADTSSTTLIFALQYLLENPETLQKLVDEVDSMIPSIDSPITIETTKNMSYINAVIYETLRLMPATAAGIMRQTQEPLVIGEYLLPAGTQITANHYTLQRDSSVWPNGDKFIPSRWLPLSLHPTALDELYTFSGGTHVCIGKNFAIMEMRLLLAMLVRCFEMRLVKGQNTEVRNMFVLHIYERKYFVDVKKRA